jgi:hypothetical protein
MAIPQTLILGIILVAHSALAMSDGIYRTGQSALVLEAKVWTQRSESGPKQFMTVSQIAPPIKEIPPIYMLVQKAKESGVWEYGDLILPVSKNRFVHGHQFFIKYSEPVSKVRSLQLMKSNGEQIVFRFVNE